MAVSKLLSGIKKVSEEVSSHDLEVSGGSNFINACGVYPVTIEKAFITGTKNGGVQLDLHFGGANSLNTRLYIVTVEKDKKGKPVLDEDGNPTKITTCKMQGKIVSLPDYKTFKHIIFLATGKGQELSEMTVKEETIKYKDFGKNIEVEAETIVDLIGKEIQIGVRLEEQYNYEDGETDKTSLKVNQNGDVVYKKVLESIFNAGGFDAAEVIKNAEEPKAIKSKIAFLESDKGIKRVALEAPEVEESEDAEEEELDF